MDFQRQTSRRLYEEHAATLRLLARADRVFAGRSGGYPPAAGDAEWPGFAHALVAAIETELARHFEFEERELFPLLAQGGDGELAALLAEEHANIRAVAQGLVSLLRQSLAAELQPREWQALKPLALEFSERLASHAQMEDGALLPLVDNMLDEDTDRELFGAYAAL